MATSRILRVLLAVILFSPASHAARSLVSPWDNINTVPTDTPYSCPTPPTFSTTLNVSAYYTDKNASIIDQKKLDEWNASTEAPVHLGQFVTRAADVYLATGSRAAARCAYSLLDAAARSAAWTESHA